MAIFTRAANGLRKLFLTYFMDFKRRRIQGLGRQNLNEFHKSVSFIRNNEQNFVGNFVNLIKAA